MQGDKICRDCCYFEKWGVAGLGHCKRFPPTIPPHLVIDQPRPRSEVTALEFEKHPWSTPIVEEEDWCGEFKL